MVLYDPFLIHNQSEQQVEAILAKSTSILFDDDCGVCTKFAKLIHKFLPNYFLIPMHVETVEHFGKQEIGNDYWKSFHIVSKGCWTTEYEAIRKFIQLLPVGSLFLPVFNIPIVRLVATKILALFQIQRKFECKR